MTQLESFSTPRVESSDALGHAGLGQNVGLEDIRSLNTPGSRELPKGFASATVNGEGNFDFSYKPQRASDLHGPIAMTDDDLTQLENRIKESPNDGCITPGEGIAYEDDKGNAYFEYLDGRKVYATENGHHLYEKDPDGHWTNSFDFGDSTVIDRMNPDGSGTTTDKTKDETTTTTWGPCGTFEKQVRIDNNTGVETILKPGPDGELVTTTLTNT